MHTTAGGGGAAAAPQRSDADQLYAAGMLEGHLTAERVWDNWTNMKDYFLNVMGAEVDAPMRW